MKNTVVRNTWRYRLRANTAEEWRLAMAWFRSVGAAEVQERAWNRAQQRMSAEAMSTEFVCEMLAAAADALRRYVRAWLRGLQPENLVGERL